MRRAARYRDDAVGCLLSGRPGDARFEKKALAALLAEHRAMASAQLGQIIEATRKLARQVESGQPAPAEKVQ
jgi:hypothetical protein